MRRTTVLEWARRFRASAELFRQTAKSRSVRDASLPGETEEWDQVVLAQLESFFWRAERRREPVW